MITYRILIVEDEPLYSSKLEMQLEQSGYKIAGNVASSDEALEVVKETPLDLVLMDIHIRGVYDGIELYEQIQKIRPIPVIYLTSQEDEMTFNRASRTQPAGFLIKPCTDLQLQRSIQLALNSTNKTIETEETSDQVHSHQDELFIQKNQKIHRVPYPHIQYLEADGRYCRIHTEEELFLVRKPLKNLMSLLPATYFVQCHRSFVINLSKVEKIDLEDDQIRIKSHRIPVSKREKEHVLERLRLIK